MSSPFVKSKLKSAREAIGKKDFGLAKALLEQVLEQEPDNYNGLVFSGLANFNLKHVEESEAAYLRATTGSPELAMAWQGLAKVHEDQKAWTKLGDVYERLIEIFGTLEEPVKLAETIQKLIELRREEGTRAQVISSLQNLLPTSPYHYLLRLLPPPTPSEPESTTTQYIQTIVHIDDLPVLEEIVMLQEKGEAQLIDKEVQKRRQRITPGVKALTKDAVEKAVKAELAVNSKLPGLYHDLCNHPSLPLDQRRATEHKLFLFHFSLLAALPTSSPMKRIARGEVLEMTRGAVLLGIEDQQMWEVELEWGDWQVIEHYPLPTLKAFVALFPDASLSTFIRGFLKYFALEDFPEDDAQEGGKGKSRRERAPVVEAAAQIESQQDVQDAAFKLLLDGFDSTPTSLLCHRILSHIHLLDRDYPSAITVATEGLNIVRRTERLSGLTLTSSRLAFQTILATSYVHHFSPKHHPLAEPLLETILAARPTDGEALMGKGYVLEARKEWGEAREVFAEVIEVLEDGRRKEVGREELGWCAFKMGEREGGRKILRGVLDGLDERKEVDEEVLEQGARVAWKLGMCYWELETAHDRQTAHDLFLSSLKRSSSFAPAFTSLGIYYADHLSPPDTIRASRCFERAFELDPREGEAARRLADSFADDKEWELVEIVAKRTIEGEGGLEGGLAAAGGEREKEAKGRFLVENVWAWKALGAVELARDSYAKAIHHFQIALRSDSKDISSWLRLSEAYAKSGKQAAALKTLARALTLEPDNWLVTFMIGDVQTQLGVHSEAIKCFKEILVARPTELGVLVALARSFLALASEESSAGYHVRAEASLIESVEQVRKILEGKVGFRALAWKHVGDVCLQLAQLSFSFDPEAVAAALSPFVKILVSEDQNGVSSIPEVVSARQLLSFKGTVDAPFVLRLAASAYTYRHHLLVGDEIAAAAASHDVAVALHHLGAALPESETKGKQACVKEATGSIKSALRVQPRNEQLWITLGTLSFESSARLSQHAFVMALEINPKNPIVWSNLGFLYLKNDDVELAGEAFLKSQTLDPDCSLAWLGQGLLASKIGHQGDARLLFEHAVGLSNDSLLEANLLYSQSTYDLFSTSSPPSTSILHAPSFALKRFCEQRPTDSTALHLHALIAERLGQYDLALTQITKSVAVLEAAYEDSEDSEVESKFAIAQSNLGRLHLALGNYQASIDAFAGTLGLVSPEDDSVRSRRLRVHAKFGSGLANYWLGELDESLGMFQAALDELEEKPMGAMKDQVSVLLAQALWGMGGEEEKEAAKSTLLECITSDSTNLDAVTTLTAIGVVSSDDTLVDAALSEILALPLDRRQALDTSGDLDWLMTRHHLTQSDPSTAESLLQKSIHLTPSSPTPLLALAKLHLQQQNSLEAVKLAKSARSANASVEEGWEALLMQAVAIASLEDGGGADGKAAMRDAQRAVVLRPWESRGWDGLEFVKGRVVEEVKEEETKE